MKKKRLNFNDDFELLYLRHEYIEKARKLGKELDSSLVQQYAGIVHTTAKIMFSKLKPNFQKCGFDEDDFVAITNMYMLSYMALYSIQTNQDEMNDLLRKKGKLDESEILRIDRNRLINFLRQRLYHCATLFARKARNITVGEDKHGFYAETDKSKEVPKDLLLTSYKKFGYRKLTLKEFKEAQKQARVEGTPDLKDKKGFKVIKVEQLNQGLSEYDFQLLSEDEKGSFYSPPDVVLENAETEIAMEAFKIRFEKMDQESRRQVLSVFVHRNYNDPKLKREVEWAEEVLAQKKIEAADKLLIPSEEKKRKRAEEKEKKEQEKAEKTSLVV